MEIRDDILKQFMNEEEKPDNRPRTRMEQMISDIYYIANNLKLLNDIKKEGNCSNCSSKFNCKYNPPQGEMMRYNCPFYEKMKRDDSQ